MSSKRAIITAIFLCVGLFSGAMVVSADVAHTVTPRTVEKTVRAGDIISTEVTITNNHPHRITVFPSVHGLELIEGEATDSIITPRTESVFGDWTTMTQAVQRLDAGESVTLTASFSIPRSIAPGVYRGVLGFGRGLNRPIAEAQVETGIAPSVVLRFTVPEPEIDEQSAVSFSVAPWVLTPEQQAVAYTIHNPSNKQVVPTGEIIFYDRRGREVAAVPVNPSGTALPPGELLTTRTYPQTTTWLGGHRAEARIEFSSSQLGAVTLSDTFMYIPWQIIAVSVLFLLLCSVGVYWRVRRQLYTAKRAHSEAAALPLHVYEGESAPEDHDINLKT